MRVLVQRVCEDFVQGFRARIPCGIPLRGFCAKILCSDSRQGFRARILGWNPDQKCLLYSNFLIPLVSLFFFTQVVGVDIYDLLSLLSPVSWVSDLRLLLLHTFSDTI